MTRSELIFRLASRFPRLLRKDAEMVVIEILSAISTALIRGHRSEIRGFGSFALNYRAPRHGRNPKTGAPVTITGKWIPHFKPGKDLRGRVEQTGDTPTG